MDTKPTTKSLHPLEEMRLAKRLTREQLAGKAGITTRTVYGIEREGRRPNLATALVLAPVLGCDPDDLIREAAA